MWLNNVTDIEIANFALGVVVIWGFLIYWYDSKTWKGRGK